VLLPCHSTAVETGFGQEKTSWLVEREKERPRHTASQATGWPATGMTGLSSSSSLFFSSFCLPEAENPHGVGGRLCDDEAHFGLLE
jgi:hypothetical protein